ncbi:Gfo/Idh/MocA family protein [Ruicaihuangia caeni]|uniref:Gfo/Idh/MocA family oxidoreductase n=1 Tax=Ruicaihuangia caeni TaxID=3042517 RepID=A0AAW6T2R9_9MICO|nr:Gfo/Idh/MocA family oxidoreductase [Klugiella sp. YN-L-19]MDI2097724.1 Gfo/Idh/MocA family oxidoreductase [Klugiella sp. YN-L-19]
MSELRLGLFGAGLIGREHAQYAQQAQGVELVAVADPTDAAKQLSAELGARHYNDYASLLEAGEVDAVIVALPNAMHADAAVAAIDRDVAVLVEKPIADTLEQASRIVDASERRGVPVLVGHQRRYAPDVAAAKKFIESGGIGEIVAVSLMSTWRKPDEYFDIEWRRRRGGGPVLINLIHDIDVIRYLAGEIDTVTALGSSKVRGFEVPETVGAVLEFANGAIGTAMLSDAAASPWNWDLMGYGAYFPTTPGDAYFISGTEASIALPSLTVFRHEGGNHWQLPFTKQTIDRVEVNPYITQLEHLVRVVQQGEAPVISARDGYNTLAVATAIDEAHASRQVTRVKR